MYGVRFTSNGTFRFHGSGETREICLSCALNRTWKRLQITAGLCWNVLLFWKKKTAMETHTLKKNNLMNTEVVFVFSLPPSFLFTVIKAMKSACEGTPNYQHHHVHTHTHTHNPPQATPPLFFGSFSCKPAQAVEWNMTHQFNYCLGIVSPRYKYWFRLLPPRISFHCVFSPPLPLLAARPRDRSQPPPSWFCLQALNPPPNNYFF